jgi:hypothetical protein
MTIETKLAYRHQKAERLVKAAWEKLSPDGSGHGHGEYKNNAKAQRDMKRRARKGDREIRISF